MRLAYLGPAGTYGEQAAKHLAALEGIQAELTPQQGIRAVIQALANGTCEAAVVPVENSVEGGVSTCLDALWEHPELAVRRALVLPIRHALLGSGPMEGISEVLSHPQALAQCALWLGANLPTALQLPTSSTAEAARLVKGSRFRAAIASREAARDHGLEVLAYPVNDVPGNCTRFLLLQRCQRDETGPFASLAFSLRSNQPGALLQALVCFAAHGLNMSRIESRPSKREMGEYIFFVDLMLPADGGAPLHQALDQLRPLCEHLALFGSYPVDSLSPVDDPAET
ncbi:MAG: prephenate dehydratase [Cyanobacteriota bacterium]|jgi:prephenate dehydratase